MSPREGENVKGYNPDLSTTLNIMAAEDRLSSVIDEEGRLFGVVNVIDALVVLLVVAVLLAGAAFVFAGDDADTRYATIELGAQPTYVAEQISPGDHWDAGAGFTVTDVYMSPAGSEDAGQTNVIVRAAVNGTIVDPEAPETSTIRFQGEPLRFGRMLEIQTADYAVEGEVVDVSTEGETIERTTEDLVIETTVDADTAGLIQPGDEYAVGGMSLLTIESVTVYPTGEREQRRVVMGVSAEARLVGDTPRFGDRQIQTGLTLPVETGTYSVTGTIINTGSLEEPGTPATVTATVDIQEMTENRADRLSVGMTEAVGDVETADLVDLDVQPSEVIVQGDSGFEVLEHPRDRDVTLTLELNVQERDDGSVRFRGEQLEVGDDLRLRLDGNAVEGEVTGLE